jgi:hypothetical protein
VSPFSSIDRGKPERPEYWHPVCRQTDWQTSLEYKADVLTATLCLWSTTQHATTHRSLFLYKSERGVYFPLVFIIFFLVSARWGCYVLLLMSVRAEDLGTWPDFNSKGWTHSSLREKCSISWERRPCEWLKNKGWMKEWKKGKRKNRQWEK